MAAMGPVVDAIVSNGATPAIQLAHAGRKASHTQPWEGGKMLAASDSGWETIAPSPISFQEDWDVPREMTLDDIGQVVDDFASSAKLAVKAGMKVITGQLAAGQEAPAEDQKAEAGSTQDKPSGQTPRNPSTDGSPATVGKLGNSGDAAPETAPVAPVESAPSTTTRGTGRQSGT